MKSARSPEPTEVPAILSMLKSRRIILILVLILSAAPSIYYFFIPYGVPFFPWIIARDDTSQYIEIYSEKYRIVFNDAGAAHSGNFWTWLIDEGLIFDSIYIQGYSSYGVRYGKDDFPVKHTDGVYYIGFCKNRRDCSLQWKTTIP